MSTMNESQTDLAEHEEILLNHARDVISAGIPNNIFGVALLRSDNLPIPEIKSRFSSLMMRLQASKNSMRYSNDSDTWFIATALDLQGLNNILAANIPQPQFMLYGDRPPEIQARFDELFRLP